MQPGPGERGAEVLPAISREIASRWNGSSRERTVTVVLGLAPPCPVLVAQVNVVNVVNVAAVSRGSHVGRDSQRIDGTADCPM